MDVIDWLLGSLYALFFYFIATNTVKKRATPIYNTYYLKGLKYKFIGVLGFAVIYLFYYKGGDSINFYYAASPLYKLFFSNTSHFFDFVLSLEGKYPRECIRDAYLKDVLYLLRGSASLTTIKIGAIFNLLSFNFYLPLCVLFAYLSYAFQWRAFKLLVGIYPSLHKQLSQAFLLLPSVIFWSSCYGKDTITLSCILQMFCSFYQVFILRQQVLKNVLFFLIAAFITSQIRGFLLFSTLPCLVIMAFTYYQSSIKSSFLRFVLGPLLLLVGVVASVFIFTKLGSVVESYNIESLQQKAEGFRSWHTTQGGSTYSIAENMEFTPTGVLKQAPLALVVTLFGPFFWQIKSPVMLLSAIESMVLLYLFTTKVFFNRRVYGLGSVLLKDHIIAFALPFIFILGTAIGLTSFNYGALVRYRISILPFFFVLFIVINYHLNQNPSVGTKGRK